MGKRSDIVYCPSLEGVDPETQRDVIYEAVLLVASGQLSPNKALLTLINQHYDATSITSMEVAEIERWVRFWSTMIPNWAKATRSYLLTRLQKAVIISRRRDCLWLDTHAAEQEFLEPLDLRCSFKPPAEISTPKPDSGPYGPHLVRCEVCSTKEKDVYTVLGIPHQCVGQKEDPT